MGVRADPEPIGVAPVAIIGHRDGVGPRVSEDRADAGYREDPG